MFYSFLYTFLFGAEKATHSHFITLHSSNFGVLSWLRSQFQGWWTNSQKARAARRLSTVMFHSWVKQHHLLISCMAPECFFFLLTIHYTHYPKPTCLKNWKKKQVLKKTFTVLHVPKRQLQKNKLHFSMSSKKRSLYTET